VLSEADRPASAERPPLGEWIAGNERGLVLASIVLLAGLAWWWTLRGALLAGSSSGDMAAMGGMGKADLLSSGPVLLAMWWIMMAAMMLPSAAPAILLYGRIRARHGSVSGIVPSWVFLAGYLIAWLAMSALVTLVHVGASAAGLFDAMAMRSASPMLSGALLIAAGLYQLTPLKNACLTHCRSPASFLARHWRPGASGAVRLGLLHGAYCVGCCWLLMALLFVGGVMNMLWIAALTALVAVEKLLPPGRAVSRSAGVLLIIAGSVRLFAWA